MYQQISSGKRITTASDDPLGAAQAVNLTIQGAALSQYSTNQTQALSSLQLEDSTLSSVSNVMQSIQTQVVHVGDSSLTDADRGSIATTLQNYRDQLFGLANTTDSNGNYIFSGLKGGQAAISNDPSGGGVKYGGDFGQRSVQISSNRTVAVGDTAASVLQAVSPTESAAVSSAATYKIDFSVSATDGSTSYTITTLPPARNRRQRHTRRIRRSRWADSR